MRKILSIIFTPLLILVLISSSISSSTSYAERADHIVVSEIQIGGDTEEAASNDEFVEIYNPTNSNVDLSNWELLKKTSAGTEFTQIATLSGIIKPGEYLLIAHEEYNGTTSADIIYNNNSVASNNTLLLRDNSGVEVDKVGMGTAQDFEGMGTASSPGNNRSIERKAFTDSTPADMAPEGIHENSGNSEDSDNNNLDFVLRPTAAGANPQNSQSPIETDVAPTPTESVVPTESISPTTTIEPTATPTDQPSPTETTTPTNIPTSTPTPTSAPKNIRIIGFFPLSRTVCYIDSSRGLFVFPKITCVRI